MTTVVFLLFFVYSASLAVELVWPVSENIVRRFRPTNMKSMALYCANSLFCSITVCRRNVASCMHELRVSVGAASKKTSKATIEIHRTAVFGVV